MHFKWLILNISYASFTIRYDNEYWRCIVNLLVAKPRVFNEIVSIAERAFQWSRGVFKGPLIERADLSLLKWNIALRLRYNLCIIIIEMLWKLYNGHDGSFCFFWGWEWMYDSPSYLYFQFEIECKRRDKGASSWLWSRRDRKFWGERLKTRGEGNNWGQELEQKALLANVKRNDIAGMCFVLVKPQQGFRIPRVVLLLFKCRR